MSEQDFVTDQIFSIKRITKYQGSDRIVNIPEEIDLIAFRAFENADIDTVVLPKNVRIICDFAFDGCKSLTRIEICNPDIDFGEAPFSHIAPEYEIIFAGTKAQFEKVADACLGTFEHQSGDYHHPSSTQFEYYKAKKYVNIFCRRDEDQFTCRVVCTDGELVYHSMPYKERIVRL